MHPFKKFTDFCGGFAAGSAIIYLFCQFMAYSPKDVESKLEKLKLFFSNESTKDYRAYLLLIALLCLSVLGGILFRKLPYLSFGLSILPLVRILAMFKDGKLYERPMLYVILGVLHVVGGLCDCIMADRVDGKHRSALAANLSALISAGVALFVLYRAKTIPPEPEKTLDFFDLNIHSQVIAKADFSVFLTIAILFALTAAISLLLWDIYFLDAAISFIPLIFVLVLWFTEKLPVHGDLIAMLALLNTVTRVAVMLSCQSKIKKNQKTA